MGGGAYSFLATRLPAEHFARALPGCVGSVSPLGDTVAPVTRDAGGSGPAKASVRSSARRLVSQHFMSLRPYAQLIRVNKDGTESEHNFL